MRRIALHPSLEPSAYCQGGRVCPPQPNGSLEPTGRPAALPQPWLRPGRPAAQFKRYTHRASITIRNTARFHAPRRASSNVSVSLAVAVPPPSQPS